MTPRCWRRRCRVHLVEPEREPCARALARRARAGASTWRAGVAGDSRLASRSRTSLLARPVTFLRMRRPSAVRPTSTKPYHRPALPCQRTRCPRRIGCLPWVAISLLSAGNSPSSHLWHRVAILILQATTSDNRMGLTSTYIYRLRRPTPPCTRLGVWGSRVQVPPARRSDQHVCAGQWSFTG